MRALVVYESMFGNTAEVAAAVADGLRTAMGVELETIEDAPVSVPERFDLLVLGAPTHAFSLSRPQTRSEAHAQGAVSGAEAIGMREWLQSVEAPGAPVFATFDTRVTRVRALPGSASKKAARIVAHRGLGGVIARESFYVTDVSGPLVEGELDRARAWGRTLADRFTAAASA